MSSRSRYVIGVDLGTSNCACSYIDTFTGKRERLLEIPQQLQLLSTTASPLLPSFTFLPPANHFGPEHQQLLLTEDGLSSRPLSVGAYAREQVAHLPSRVITSAKSWLVQEGQDRTDKILPWRSEEITEEEKLSPVTVSAAYLAYIKREWDRRIAKRQEELFAHQEVTVTVPASFDEVAQQLTLQACTLAGFPASTRLLEEPQSAFYFFLAEHEPQLRKLPMPEGRNRRLLVVDIGGGTSDFSLFEISSAQELSRVAVSDHLLVGGDNLDLTLAYHIESTISEKLSPARWHILVSQARALKEEFLTQLSTSSETNQRYSVTIPPRAGGDLFAAVETVTLSSADLSTLLVEGFFPKCSSDTAPKTSGTGLREGGLAYAKDSRITAHLAAFLDGREIDALLFTGGTLKPLLFQERIVSTIASWQKGRRPTLLQNEDLDCAVARGASLYGLALREDTQQIRGGYPHTVYLQVLHKKRPVRVCIVPRGTEAPFDRTLEEYSFDVLSGEPARFQLSFSRVRGEDTFGSLLSSSRDADRITNLPPLQQVLPTQKTKGKKERERVQVRVALKETGILGLSCKSLETNQEWTLDFNLRRLSRRPSSGSRTASETATETTSPHLVERASELLDQYFGTSKKKAPQGKVSPKRVTAELERVIGKRRQDWELPLLRRLWNPLSQGITKRRRSLGHEVTFFTLAGLFLRPGYGDDLDEYRVRELWRCVELGLAYPKERQAQLQWWIMWRRVAGGLSRYEQRQLYLLVAPLLAKEPEVMRLCGALERLHQQERVAIGTTLANLIPRSTSLTPHHFWALERVMARVPTYASNEVVLPEKHLQRWFHTLNKLDWRAKEYRPLCNAFAQACRITGDRTRDVSVSFRDRVREKLTSANADGELRRLLVELVPFSERDFAEAFGEELPIGIRLLEE